MLNQMLQPSSRNLRFQQCPYCGAKQEVTRPLDGIFPYLNCESCKRSFFVQSDFKVRKLTEEEKVDIPCAWIQIVEDCCSSVKIRIAQKETPNFSVLQSILFLRAF